MKQQSIEVYINELMNYKKNKNNWDGKIKRKENKKLYAWYKEIINGRRRIDLDIKFRLTEIGLNLNGMVSEYNNHDFKTWLSILEDYLHTNYYYGVKNKLRDDKKHISLWDGTLKLNSGDFKNHNLYKWYQQLKQKKYIINENEKQILENLGLKLKSNIAKRLSFEQWLEILNEFKKDNGGEEWNGIVSTKIKSYKNRNLYGFINSLRDKKLSINQIEKLKKIGLKNKLTRK